MPFGGWAIEYEVLRIINLLLPTGSTILELGSGEGTKELCKNYTVFSIEQNIDYLGTTSSTYIYAPIKEYKPSKQFPEDTFWYDREILKDQLPLHYDLILVDGPSGSNRRAGFWKYRNLFKFNDVPIVFDDANKRNVIHMASLFARVLTLNNAPRQIATFHTESKTFAVVASPSEIKKLI